MNIIKLNLSKIKKLIKFLAAEYKNINFIVRPHPSEKIESYNDLKKSIQMFSYQKNFLLQNI